MKAEDSIQNVFLVMNQSIRTYGKYDQRNSDKSKRGEMLHYISSAGPVSDLLSSARALCEKPPTRLRDAGIQFLSLKTNNCECIIHNLIFESFILLLRQCALTMYIFSYQWGVWEGNINCNLPALFSLEIKSGFFIFFPLFLLLFSTKRQK